MFWPTIKRIFKAGFANFFRNGFVSLAAILMMMVPLFFLSSLIFSNFLLDNEIQNLQDKVDVNVYFVTTADEQSILTLKTALQNIPEVATVTYTSKDDALAAFRTKHQDDQLTLQALDELGSNPFGAELSIKAKQTSEYEAIAQFLQDRTTDANGKPLIDTVNYYQNKLVIGQLSDMIARSEQGKFFQIFFLAIIAFLVILNTIRLTIYHSREEIRVMRLVGAPNTYIEGPFVIEGLLYGAAAALLILLVLFPVTYWFGSYFSAFPSLAGQGADTSVFHYYVGNFPLIFLMLVGSGLILSALSSFLAVRRYLSV